MRRPVRGADHDRRDLPGPPGQLSRRPTADATLVVTGEGGLDEQTFAGKAVGEVARRARRAGVPCVAVVGRTQLSSGRARELGLDRVIEAPTLDALRGAGREIAETAGTDTV